MAAPDEEQRAVLERLVERGDAAEIASHLLAEGRIGPVRPDDPDERVLGRDEDLLAQDRGDELTFVGWVAALANGVRRADGIETWARRALADAAADPSSRPVLWSEIRAGDLVVGLRRGRPRAAVALDGRWGVRLGSDGLARVALVDLVDPGHGPRVLRDKLWFWSSYGAVEEPTHLRDRTSVAATSAEHRAAGALWAAGAVVLALVALVVGSFVLGGGERGDDDSVPRRGGLFPLDRLDLVASTPGGTTMRWCTDGVPGDLYDGDLRGIRIRRVDVYAFDDDTLLVDVDLLEPLDETLEALPRRAVRGYALDAAGLAQGLVQVVERTPSGQEVLGRLTLSGVLVPDSASAVAVADHFQFFLETAGLDDPGAVVVAVDSIGGEPSSAGALPCHSVVTDPLAAG